MRTGDTSIHKRGDDTRCEGIELGERIRIATGCMEGQFGTLIDRRPRGRVLIHLVEGTYVEINTANIEQLEQ